MTADCVIALVLIGLVLLIGLGTLVARLVHDRREQQTRIDRQQIVTGAEQELRESTRATLQSMRDVLRDHLQG